MRPLTGGKHSKSSAVKRNSSHNNMRGQSAELWEERRLHVSMAEYHNSLHDTNNVFLPLFPFYSLGDLLLLPPPPPLLLLDVDRLTRPSESQGFHSLNHSDRRQPQALTLSATPPTVFEFWCPPCVKTRNEAEFNCERRFLVHDSKFSPNVRLMIQRKF